MKMIRVLIFTSFFFRSINVISQNFFLKFNSEYNISINSIIRSDIKSYRDNKNQKLNNDDVKRKNLDLSTGLSYCSTIGYISDKKNIGVEIQYRNFQGKHSQLTSFCHVDNYFQFNNSSFPNYVNFKDTFIYKLKYNAFIPSLITDFHN